MTIPGLYETNCFMLRLHVIPDLDKRRTKLKQVK